VRRLLTGLALAAAIAAGVGPGAAKAAVAAAACPPPRDPPPVTQVKRARWLSGVLVTEYFPAPERFFTGRLVSAPGLPGRYRIDWLYSARGLAMQGQGLGRDGRMYHFAGPYSLTWRNARGEFTYPCTESPGHWTRGRPAWIGPTWLNPRGTITFPLPKAAWSNGRPQRAIPAEERPRFARGAARTLAYWRNVAVDPRLVPQGSAVFVPAYCRTPSRGWFTAADTGGAILGLHIDVYRAPPERRWDSRVLRRQKIFVVPPGRARPASVRCGAG
jgi:hypothetical protein